MAIIFETNFSNDVGWSPPVASVWQTSDLPTGWSGFKRPANSTVDVIEDASAVGGYALRLGYQIGTTVSALTLGKHLTRDKDTGYTELYVRYHVKFGTNWKSGTHGSDTQYWKWGRFWQYRTPTGTADWSENFGDKDTRYVLWTFTGKPSPYIACTASDNVNGNSASGQFVRLDWALDPETEGHFETIDDWDINRTSDGNAGLFDLYPTAQTWHFIEYRVKLSSDGAPSEGDGVFEVWIDGAKQPKWGRITNKNGASGFTELPTKQYQGGMNWFTCFDNMSKWSLAWDSEPPVGDTGVKFIYVSDIVISDSAIGTSYVVGGGSGGGGGIQRVNLGQTGLPLRKKTFIAKVAAVPLNPISVFRIGTGTNKGLDLS